MRPVTQNAPDDDQNTAFPALEMRQDQPASLLLRPTFRRPHAEQRAHQNAQVEARHMNDVGSSLFQVGKEKFNLAPGGRSWR